MKCDNTSVISLSKNPIKHSHIKFIEMTHHFLRGHTMKGDIVLEFVRIEHQLANILTKPLGKDCFYEMRNLGFIYANNN